MMSPLTEAEITAIEQNLFFAARHVVRQQPDFLWHRDQNGRIDAHVPHSSQALAVDLFETVRCLHSRSAILDAWTSALKLNLVGNIWSGIDLEVTVPKALLGEPTPTQVDAVACGTNAKLLFECKFTERDGGGCSQVKPCGPGANQGKVQCNGNYELQVNPVNRVQARCALTGKGIRYWDHIPSVLIVSAAIDHVRCPFRGGRYQWMRNLVVARAIAQQQAISTAFIVVYADGPFPLANKIQTEEWHRFENFANQGSVPQRTVSYQKLIELAQASASAEDRVVLTQLSAWVCRKIQNVSSGEALPL